MLCLFPGGPQPILILNLFYIIILLSADQWSLKTLTNSSFNDVFHCIADNTFLFLPTNKYIFKGAEVYDNGDEADDDSEDDDDDDSSSDDSLTGLDVDSLTGNDAGDNENNGNNRNRANKVTTSVETQQTNSDNNSNSGSSDVNGECRSVDASCSCSVDSKEGDGASNTSLVHSLTTTKAAQVELCSSTSLDLG